MSLDQNSRMLDYESLKNQIIEEAEQYNRINFATSYNGDVHTFYPLCVFDGLKAYIVLIHSFVWTKHIELNPNVALTTYNKQFKGKARILGNPYDDQFWRIRVKFRSKHKVSWDRCINVPGTVLIEIKISHVTMMDYGNDYVPLWKVTHLDLTKKEAFWHYIMEEFPYWHRIQEKEPIASFDGETIEPKQATNIH